MALVAGSETGYKANEMVTLHQAVLFDLDGTLLDTLQDLADAVNQGLATLQLPAHSLAQFKYLVGEGREEMVRKALPEERRDPDTLKFMLDFVNVYYGSHWRDHTRPYAGIPELLNALTSRSVAMAVFSNKPQEFTSQNVAGLLPDWQFASVLGASPSVPKKPDCSAALRIAADLGFSPADFLYLGDSGIDMQTARRAGMYPVGALWGFRTRAELLENGALAVIEKPLDLLALL
jgi:phosphoglycolate phosphatase